MNIRLAKIKVMIPSVGDEKRRTLFKIQNLEVPPGAKILIEGASGKGKTTLLHTLNGSALALPRIVATILENNQTPEGIRIPKVLIPYCGFDLIS